jgi:polyisoprenoid-binding protein YceI
VPAANAPAATSGFLSFSLPSRSFSFAGPQRLRVLSSLSRVGFDAKSTLHDFSGVTSEVRGDVVADLADPHYPWSGEIRCQAASLRTGVDGRDESMREHLDTEHHSDIRFEVRSFRADPGDIDVPARTAHGTAVGMMTIRGETRELEMPVQISVDASQRVVVEGQAKLKLTDFGVPVPSQLGLISMEDEVAIWVSLRARSLGSVEETER